MKTVQLSKESMQQAALAIPENTPILMLNLLRYRAQADYGGRKDMEACTGREAYFKGYVPAFNEVAKHVKSIQPFFVGNAVANLVAPAGEFWDDVALVEYPSYAAFLEVVENPEYIENAEFHRLAALEDWRLIATVKFTLG